MTASGLTACGDPEIAVGSGSGTGGHSASAAHGSGGSSGTFDPDAGVGGSSGTMIQPDAACAMETVKASIIPVNMFILFDRSSSMAYKSKFPQATAALTAFFQDPGTAGLRVALRFFPDQTCNTGSCDAKACTPPLVPLGALVNAAAPTDTQEQALVSAVTAVAPDADENTGLGTPMSSALDGAEQWATGYQLTHPSEKVVVVLVSDGEPHGCDMSYATLNNLASTAHAKGVTTYVVGLAGFFQSQMDALAQSGGTGQAFFIDPKVNVEASLLMDLQSIQKGQVSCSMPMPTSAKGTVDPTQVNVDYTPGGGGKVDVLAEVPNAAACDATGGWYYDDPTKPTMITLCPATCAVVQADAAPKIDVLLQCVKMIN